jgi:hypothetical protein
MLLSYTVFQAETRCCRRLDTLPMLRQLQLRVSNRRFAPARRSLLTGEWMELVAPLVPPKAKRRQAGNRVEQRTEQFHSTILVASRPAVLQILIDHGLDHPPIAIRFLFSQRSSRRRRNLPGESKFSRISVDLTLLIFVKPRACAGLRLASARGYDLPPLLRPNGLRFGRYLG